MKNKATLVDQNGEEKLIVTAQFQYPVVQKESTVDGIKSISLAPTVKAMKRMVAIGIQHARTEKAVDELLEEYGKVWLMEQLGFTEVAISRDGDVLTGIDFDEMDVAFGKSVTQDEGED